MYEQGGSLHATSLQLQYMYVPLKRNKDEAIALCITSLFAVKQSCAVLTRLHASLGV